MLYGDSEKLSKGRLTQRDETSLGL